MDPYFDATFVGWFYAFFVRMCSFFDGELYSDEIQLIVMVLFAVGAGFLGGLLVLKRLTMMANALSHTMMFGIVVALILTYTQQDVVEMAPSEYALVLAAVIVGLLTSFCTERLSSCRFIQEDAGNGMVFSFFFALGVTILSLWSKSAHAGPELLIGNPDALQASDIPIVFWSTLLILVVGVAFLRGFSCAIFDPSFASFSGFRPSLFINILLALVALAAISAFRAVGFVMTLAFFVFPPLIAKQFTKQLRPFLGVSVLVGCVAAIVAIALARHLFSVYFIAVSTGALSATVLVVWYGLLCSTLWVYTKTSRKSTYKNQSCAREGGGTAGKTANSSY